MARTCEPPPYRSQSAGDNALWESSTPAGRSDARENVPQIASEARCGACEGGKPRRAGSRASRAFTGLFRPLRLAGCGHSVPCLSGSSQTTTFESRRASGDAADTPEMRSIAGDAKQAKPPFLTHRFLKQRARAVRLVVHAPGRRGRS